MEYLLGRLLEDGLVNMGIRGETRQALSRLGLDFAALAEQSTMRVSATEDSPLGGVFRFDGDARHLRHRLRHPLRVRHFSARHRRGPARERPDNRLRYGNPWSSSDRSAATACTSAGA
jgi:hypothetical protein